MARTGRSVNGGASAPHFPASERAEVARNVRTAASRFLADRATFDDVIEAARLVIQCTEQGDSEGNE